VFPVVQAELKKGIAELQGNQLFNVILFRNDRPQAFLDGQMLSADDANKKDGMGFVDAVTAGDNRWDLQRAVEQAFKQQPLVIYLITTPALRSRAVLMNFHHWELKQKIPINTVMVIPSGTDREQRHSAEVILQQVSRETGGKYQALEAPS